MGLTLAVTTDWHAATKPIFCHTTPSCRVMLGVDTPAGVPTSD
jgi:hypothetical protein